MSANGTLDPALVAILRCPVTRTALRHDAARGELVSDAAGLAYPVRGGVPVLLADAARRIDGGEAPADSSGTGTNLTAGG